MKKVFYIIPMILALAACEDSSRMDQSRIAQQAADKVMADAQNNSEIDNIAERITLTSNPNLLGHVAIFNQTGQIILYTTVKGNITSGSKRLTNPSSCGGEMSTCPNDEGTYGSSNPYIFFKNTSGQYFQTSMDYIYSDKPFRTEEKPILAVLEQKNE